MKYVSTSALAKQNGIASNELFSTLKGKGWIFKKDDSWQLTKEGRIAGGDIKYNPKYGEYIVWPVNLDINQTIKREDTLTSSKLGEEFGISAQKTNLILAELGWIEKSDVGGWGLTKVGKRNGGYQMEAPNGSPYVIWSNSIQKHKSLLDSIKAAKGEYTSSSKDVASEGALNDYRLKYPANYRTQDGHRVRSKSEAMIDDYLYREGIAHAYERKLPIEEDVISDFYILKGNVYIEYWGIENDPIYESRKKKKLEIYSKEGFNLIELTESDVQNIDDFLPKKLRRHKIKVGNNN